MIDESRTQWLSSTQLKLHLPKLVALFLAKVKIMINESRNLVGEYPQT